MLLAARRRPRLVKIVVFGPDKRVGVWAGDKIVDLARASAAFSGSAGAPLPANLLEFIEGGAPALADAARVVEAALASAPATHAANGVHRRADVRLHAPHVPGARILCAGGNFADHAAAMASRNKTTSEPPDLKSVTERLRAGGIWGFWKVGRDAAEPDGDILYPARTKRLDYEGELAIVIGKTVKDFNRTADVTPYVWGITLFGDWSIRDRHEPDAPLKIGMAKNFDGSFSIGPCIVVNETIDPGNVDVETLVNGERRQHFNTRDMIFSFAEFLAYVTTDFTMHPGDVISGGTAKGTAADSSPRLPEGGSEPERFLKAGDRVEMRSPAIGTLAARIITQ
jgi:2-keto-4-pentenoate hydratase/2-oxohepta-3-ene-1,7-dioic acid hydratase in catechol pathway